MPLSDRPGRALRGFTHPAANGCWALRGGVGGRGGESAVLWPGCRDEVKFPGFSPPAGQLELEEAVGNLTRSGPGHRNFSSE